jgi:hypothetical protein
MSSGIFGSAPLGQLSGSNSDPFSNVFGGATPIGPTQRGGSQADPFAGTMGGATQIAPFANPFGTVTPNTHAQAFRPQNMGQGQGGQASGGQQAQKQGQSPLSTIGQVAGMFGSGQKSQSSNPFGQGMWANQQQPNGFVLNGARGPQGADGQGQGQGTPFASGGNMAPVSAGTPNQYAPNGMPMQGGQMVNNGGNMAPVSAGTPNMYGPGGTPATGTVVNPSTASNIVNNFQNLPTGGSFDGGMGNLGSFLGGLFR